MSNPLVRLIVHFILFPFIVFVPNSSFTSSNGDSTLNNTFNSDWAQYNMGTASNNNSNRGSTQSLTGKNNNGADV